MSYNFRQRVQKSQLQPPKVIYDDLTLVPVGKMSFAVSQWKTMVQMAKQQNLMVNGQVI